MARAIDSEKYMELLKEQYLHYKAMKHGEAARAWQGAIQLLYDMPTLTPPNDWISVEDRLPEAEKEVWIACKTKPGGYLYQCVGFYIPHGFYQEDSDYTWDWEALGEYSEERDDYYINEGWYERVHNWDDYGAVVIGDFVTHWMPLPQPPKEAQS